MRLTGNSLSIIRQLNLKDKIEPTDPIGTMYDIKPLSVSDQLRSCISSGDYTIFVKKMHKQAEDNGDFWKCGDAVVDVEMLHVTLQISTCGTPEELMSQFLFKEGPMALDDYKGSLHTIPTNPLLEQLMEAKGKGLTKVSFYQKTSPGLTYDSALKPVVSPLTWDLIEMRVNIV